MGGTYSINQISSDVSITSDEMEIKALVLNGNTLNIKNDVLINFTKNNAITDNGSLFVDGNIIRKDEKYLYIDDGALTVTGDYGDIGSITIRAKGEMKVGGNLKLAKNSIIIVGKLEVDGDCILEKETVNEETGEMEHEKGTASMTMLYDSSEVIIKGDMVLNSNTDSSFAGGVLTLKGNLTQKGECVFRSSGTHKTILDSESKQYLIFENTQSHFNDLYLMNDKDMDYVFLPDDCWTSLYLNVTVEDIKINSPESKLETGGMWQFVAEVSGKNKPEQTVIWSVSNNTNNDTKISDNGLLTIAQDEKADLIYVTATSIVDDLKSVTSIVHIDYNMPSVELKFSGASLTLQDNISVNFKVSRLFFDEYGYKNPYVVFKLNNVETVAYDYAENENNYVFTFRNVAPNQMNDIIEAQLFATYDDTEYLSEIQYYSVATYCYNMLNKYNSDAYKKLRTLLVDLLNYGAQSQIYTSYKEDRLVNAALTQEQCEWGTSEQPELKSVLNTSFNTVENPSVTWKGAGLKLEDSVTMRFKIQTDNIDNIKVIITGDTDKWTIYSKDFIKTIGGYYIYFNGLNASQLRETVYLTIYDGEQKVSNTICYSIESYAYSKRNDETLAGLTESMMKYGDSAYAYIHNSR